MIKNGWFIENHTDTVEFKIKIKSIIAEKKSSYQNIQIFDTYDFGIVMAIDDFIMLTAKDEFIYHEMIVHVPMATLKDVKKVLVIGGGDGGTLRELVKYSDIEKIDIVEIDQDVIELSKKYIPFTSSGYLDDRVKVIIGDGVQFVNKSKNIYDLIIIDSTDPIGPGEGLFSYQFYKDCKKILSKDGALINQHESPYYESDSKEMKRAHMKLSDIFNNAKVYQFHMPTYPSGHWLFGFASNGIDPIKNHDKNSWEIRNISTKYYNSLIHKGSFYLPNYVNKILKEDL